MRSVATIGAVIGGLSVVAPVSVRADDNPAQAVAETLPELRSYQANSELMRCLEYSADGQSLLASGVRGGAAVFDPRSGGVRAKWTQDGGVQKATFRRDGSVAYEGYARGRQAFFIRNFANGQETLAPVPEEYHLRLSAVLPGGELVFKTETEVGVWSPAQAKYRWRRPVLQRGDPIGIDINGVAVSPDGKMLAVSYGPNMMVLYNTEDGSELRRVRDRDPVCPVRRAIAFSPCGRRLLAGSAMNTAAFLVDVPSLARLETVRCVPDMSTKSPEGSDPTEGVCGAAFSADGKTFALACKDYRVRFYETATRGVRREARLFGWCLAFPPVGRGVAVGSCWNGSVGVYDWHQPAPGRPAAWSVAEGERLWATLTTADAGDGFRAVCDLAAAPDRAVPFIAARLLPARACDPVVVGHLIGELGADRCRVREQATAELRYMGPVVVSRLRRALPTAGPEAAWRIKGLLARSDRETAPERLRVDRAIEVLELCATAEAARVLDGLAAGAAESPMAADAAAACRRLEMLRR